MFSITSLVSCHLSRFSERTPLWSSFETHSDVMLSGLLGCDVIRLNSTTRLEVWSFRIFASYVYIVSIHLVDRSINDIFNSVDTNNGTYKLFLILIIIICFKILL